MKTTVFILFIAAFLQTTVLPINLVLIILICRAYIKPGQINLFLAFAFGLLIAYLSLGNLGLQALNFLVLIQLAQIFSKIKFFTHPILIVPLTFILLSIYELVNSLLNQQSPQIIPTCLFESITSFFIYYLIALWEERFIVPKDIKLKFR